MPFVSGFGPLARRRLPPAIGVRLDATTLPALDHRRLLPDSAGRISPFPPGRLGLHFNFKNFTNEATGPSDFMSAPNLSSFISGVAETLGADGQAVSPTLRDLCWRFEFPTQIDRLAKTDCRFASHPVMNCHPLKFSSAQRTLIPSP